MKSYKQQTMHNTSLKINTSKEGERLETKIERMLNNGETNDQQAPLIYTERKEGIRPEHDIRTDRFEVAIEASEKINKSYTARREERQKATMKINKNEETNKDSGAEPTQGKSAN